jgi:hypothetical protein
MALSFVASLSACVFPVQRPDEELFKDDTLAFIEIGKTTKAEIASAMSNLVVKSGNDEVNMQLTPRKYRGGNWWLYAQTRKEQAWIVWAGPGLAQLGDVDYRFLLLKFDKNGVVAGYELSSSEGYGCNREGVCVLGSSYSLLASKDEDRVVKQFDVLSDHCGIYVYAKSKIAGFYYANPISIWLDGHQVDWLLNKEHFFFWQLDQGVHQLAPHGPDDSFQLSIEFSCVAGYVYFFELTPKQGGIEIEHRDAVLGRKAIGKRQLTLSPSE